VSAKPLRRRPGPRTSLGGTTPADKHSKPYPRLSQPCKQGPLLTKHRSMEISANGLSVAVRSRALHTWRRPAARAQLTHHPRASASCRQLGAVHHRAVPRNYRSRRLGLHPPPRIRCLPASRWIWHRKRRHSLAMPGLEHRAFHRNRHPAVTHISTIRAKPRSVGGGSRQSTIECRYQHHSGHSPRPLCWPSVPTSASGQPRWLPLPPSLAMHPALHLSRQPARESARSIHRSSPVPTKPTV